MILSELLVSVLILMDLRHDFKFTRNVLFFNFYPKYKRDVLL